MALHRLTHVTLGVPDVDAAAAYCEDLGLVAAPLRRPLELGIGADDADDLAR